MAQQIEPEDIAPDQIPAPKWDDVIDQNQGGAIQSYGGATSPIAGAFQSANFKSGQSGWRLDSNGNFEGNAGTFREL